MEKLTGWKKDEVMPHSYVSVLLMSLAFSPLNLLNYGLQVLGKALVGDVFGMQIMCCRLKGQDAVTKFMIVLNNAMDGQDTEKFPFSFFDRNGKFVEALLTANKRTDADGYITGVFCFLHIASPELLQVTFTTC